MNDHAVCFDVLIRASGHVKGLGEKEHVGIVIPIKLMLREVIGFPIIVP